jgi:hypothetical protein
VYTKEIDGDKLEWRGFRCALTGKIVSFPDCMKDNFIFNDCPLDLFIREAELIPVAWIEKWMTKSGFPKWTRRMIDDWRKENDIY